MIFTFLCNPDDVPTIWRKLCFFQLTGLSDTGGGVPTSCIRIQYEDDTCIRELYQWAAAAFACGLIESPRIERM